VTTSLTRTAPSPPLAARISRAWQLARERAATADLLTFYGDLAEYQQSLLAERARVIRHPDPRFGDALDARAAAALMPGLLRWLESRPQQGLAGVGQTLRGRIAADWTPLLESYWRRGGVSLPQEDEIEQFVLEALLQPFAESVALSLRNADAGEVREPSESRRFQQCPVCGGQPIVATLRERGHGARRSLVCGFCLTDWPMPRVVCPFCDESSFEALLIYRAEEFPDVRIDACRSCATYVKTLDLTVNGAAIPIVDDLASLAMDLWAAGREYRKVRPNLLRL
jgi:FdhE protein